MKLDMTNIFLVFKIYKNIKKNFFIIITLSIILIIFDILGIFLLGYLIALILDFDLSNSMLGVIERYFVFLNNFEIIFCTLLVFISKFIINLLTYKKIFSYIKKEQKNLANNFATKILMSLKKETNKMKLFSSFTEFLRLSTEYYLVYFLKFISEFIILISIMLFLFFIDYKLSILLFICILTFFIFFFRANKKKINEYGKNVTDNYEKFLNKAKYLIYSTYEIKAFKKEYEFKLDTLKYFNDYSDNRFKQIFFSFMPRLYAELFFVLFLIAIAGYLNLFSNFGQSSLPALTLFVLILIRAIPLTSALIFSLTNIWNFNYANEIVFNFLKDLKQSESIQKIQKQNTSLEKIVVSEMSFSYKEKLLYGNLSFTILKNQIFGIFGRSGSGKTTLGLILMGLIKEHSGKVSFKYNNKQLQPKNLDIFSYIPQDINLMEDTIYRNIVYDFKKKYNKKKIVTLLKKFNLFYELKGHNFKDISTKLSGGQKQRILICRAIYNQKSVIILDEPSSYLDKKNIRYLIKYLLEIKSKMFVIIISHDHKLKKICKNSISL